ncbi:MAG: methyltransferase domain-containing protein [Dehalococcoidia bacterium]|nr:methyltransferase domain-containing protein [Dehalococcoidia bacterium]
MAKGESMDATDNAGDTVLEPARFLAENIDLLPRGRALDIAMGSGRNAVYLAKMGFTVEGVDNSSEAIEQALALAREEGVSIQTRVEDLNRIPYFEEEAYDLVICFRYLQRSLMPQMKNWVKPGGMLVYETFIVDQVQFGRPRSPEHLLRHNELLHTFRDLRVLRYREGVFEGNKAVASMLAQKVRADQVADDAG